MSAEEQIRQLGRLQASQRGEDEQRYRDASKERLVKCVETKINTTMIGSLSLIEEKLGHMWGQGKPRHMLTETERRMSALKDELRTEILNNGNTQKRAAIAEINQYDVHWNRYHYDIGINDNDHRKR
jgi:hypothetical protein